MRSVVVLVLGVAGLLAAMPVHAQESRPSRPYRGLFGSGIGDSEQVLVANGSLGGGYDDSLLSDAFGDTTIGAGDPRYRHRGGLGQATGSLTYALNRDRVNVGGGAGTTFRYYPSLDTVYRTEYASAQGSVRVVRGLSVFGSAAYQPYSLSSLHGMLFSTIAADPAGIGDEFLAVPEQYFTYTGGANYNHRLSRRTSIDANYTYADQAWSGGSADVFSFERHSAGARLVHNVGRGFDVRLGYEYSDARYADAARQYEGHQIDAGVDYNRALSFSRRTTLSFSTGTSAIGRPEAVDEGFRYYATGRARLAHEIGRTWTAMAGYERGLEFSEAWPEPVFSDSVSAGFGGLINRRTQLQLEARASSGRLGYTNDQSEFEHYYGTATLSYALSRYVSLGATYAYYHHRFDAGVLLPPGFPNDVGRQSVRGYVNLWAPLFSRPRRP